MERHSLPVVLYRNKDEARGREIETLYSKLKEKSRRIRVFYFNQDRCHCDHQNHHNQRWKEQLNGSSLEAGTVVEFLDCEITRSVADQERHYFTVIQWDCGFIKVYSKPELDDIRVFDLGPAG